MKPITREEYYLAKIAGTWQGKTPEPVTIEEYYLATMAGDYSGNTPQPVTRLQYYMAKAAGVWGGSIPAPVTRLEYYWAAIAGKEGHIPDPVTRQEYLLYTISQSNNDVINTVFGTTIIINDAAEDRPFRGVRVFGKSTQRTTTGAQLLSIKQEDVANKDGLSAKVNVDGGITVTGTPDKQYATIYEKDIILSPGKYYLNGGNGSAGAVLLKARITFSDGSSKNCANGSFEVTPDTKSVSILIQYESATIQSVNYTIYPMLNKGETALPFEPYTGGKPSPSPEYKQEPEDAGKDGSIEVKVGGRNLFDGKFESGSIRQDNGENQDYADRIRTAGFIQIKPSTVYSIKLLETISFSVRWYDKDKKFIKSEATNTISQSPDNARYMRFLLLTTKLDTKCMVYAGSAPTPYEPYRDPQTLTLATPNGLPGIPVTKDGNYTDENGQQWICDEIDLGRGKYMQRTDEKDVSEAIPLLWSGAGKWGNNDGYKTLAFYAYINGSNSNKNWDAVKNYGICNYAIITSNVFNNSVIGFSLGDYIAFRIPRSLLPDWDENNPSNDPWVNWLKARKEAGNPVIVRYALANPIERDLTPEEIAAYKTLHTNYPSTVISNDAGAHMEVSYVADTKNYIDNKFAALNKAVLDAVGGK